MKSAIGMSSSDDADEIDDAFVLDGLEALDVYLARVAAFSAWVAKHGEPKTLGPDQIDPYSDEYQEAARKRRAERRRNREAKADDADE